MGITPDDMKTHSLSASVYMAAGYLRGRLAVVARDLVLWGVAAQTMTPDGRFHLVDPSTVHLTMPDSLDALWASVEKVCEQIGAHNLTLAQITRDPVWAVSAETRWGRLSEGRPTAKEAARAFLRLVQPLVDAEG